jgi:hypothetical protein
LALEVILLRSVESLLSLLVLLGLVLVLVTELLDIILQLRLVLLESTIHVLMELVRDMQMEGIF